MGTDIDVCAQIRKDGAWEFVKKTCKPDCLTCKNNAYPEHVYDIGIARNYALFGILANVRAVDEYFGFGEPRGLPEGVWNDVFKGDSCFSHLTLEQIDDFDWEKKTKDKVSYRTLSREFMTTFYDMLVSLIPTGGSSEDVRILFGFN